MKKLTQGIIESTRKLLVSSIHRELAVLVLKSANKEDYDILDVFDFDTCISLSGSSDAEGYLAGGYEFRDIDVNGLASACYRLGQTCEEYGSDFLELEHRADDVLTIHLENKDAYEMVESKLNTLLRLAFLLSPEDCISMNGRVYNIFNSCLK